MSKSAALAGTNGVAIGAVAIAVAVGAGLYVSGALDPGTPQPDPEVAQDVVQPQAPVVVEESAALVAPEPEADPEPEAVAAVDPEPVEETPVVIEPPRFDLVRLETDGSALVAGVGEIEREIGILLDGEKLATVITGSDGRFVSFLDIAPSEVPRVLSLVMMMDDGPLESEEQVILAPTPVVVAEADVAPEGEEPVVETAEGDAQVEDPAVEVAEVEPQAEEPAVEVAEVEPQAEQPAVEVAEVEPQAEEPAVEVAEVEPQAEEPAVEVAEVEPQAEEPAVEVAEVEPQAEEPAVEVAEVEPQAEEPAVEVAEVEPQAEEPGVEVAEVEPQAEEPAVEVAEVEPQAEEPAVEVADVEPQAEEPAVKVAEVEPQAEEPAVEVAKVEPEAEEPAVDVAAVEPQDQEPAVETARADAPALEAPEVDAAPVDPVVSTSTGQKVPAVDVQVTAPVLLAAPELPEVEDTPQALVTRGDPKAPEADPVVVAKVQNPEAEPRAVPEPDVEVAEVSDQLAEPATAVEKGPEVVASTTVLLSDKTGVRVLQAPSVPGVAPQVLSSVALDAITYDDTGDVALSGRGAGRTAGFVRVYLDNKPITTSRIREDGSWKADLPEVDTGVYTLRVDQVDDQGAVTSRVESPFKRESREALAQVRDEEKTLPIKAVTVQPGDTLWAISRERYGEGILYVHVFQANRDRIRDPDLIYPGQIFALPKDEVVLTEN